MNEIVRRCFEHGIRMTRQRRVIAEVMSESDDHPDVNEIHRRAAALDGAISIATVYRTLRLLRESGLLQRHDFADGAARYENAATTHHDHLIDVDSGEVIEFRNETIEKLQIDIAARHGYRLVGHKLELYGEKKVKP